VTRVLLVRHATNDTVGRLVAGWTPGVHLNEEGRGQAERLARRLAGERLRAVYASSLERTLETARPIAAAHRLEVQARVVSWLEGVRDRHAGREAVAAVTHGDVVKAAVFHCGGVSLDQVHRWDIAPAFVSTLELEASGARLVSVNDTGGTAGP